MAVAFTTFRDYGLGWDDYTQSQYGDLLLSLYGSGFSDKRALSFVNVYMYGGGFDLAAALTAKFLPFGLFAVRRLLGGLIGIGGLVGVWRLARRFGGPLAGVCALVLLAACPLYYGHMFINSKDAPFAAAMVLALLGIVRALDEYPRPEPVTVALCGLGFGFSIGSRVLGGFAVIDAVLALAVVVALRWRQSGFKIAGSECGTFVIRFIPAVILALLLMALIWPWSVLALLNLFRAVAYFAHDFEKPWRELFDGHLIPITQMPRSYVPTLFALKVPALMLALGLAGMAAALVAAVRDRPSSAGRRGALMALVLAAALPVLLTVATRPYIYNGIRHLIFVLPPFAVAGGLAAGWTGRWLSRHGAAGAAAGGLVFAAGIALPVNDMIRLHPYEYTDYNRLAGGVRDAQHDFMLDYWGLSLTQASRRLAAYVDDHRLQPVRGQWTIAVCGPHPPVAVALGSQYALSWNPNGADFAMQLGVFYCAKLDAPLLFEVSRDGVVYARVYDIRKRTIASLLTVPGIDRTNY